MIYFVFLLKKVKKRLDITDTICYINIMRETKTHKKENAMKTFTTTTNTYTFFTKDVKFLKKWSDEEMVDLVFFEGPDEDCLPDSAEKIYAGVWAVDHDSE